MALDDETTCPLGTVREAHPRRYCRHKGCGERAVVEVNVGHTTYTRSPPRRRDAWWGYCAVHAEERALRHAERSV